MSFRRPRRVVISALAALILCAAAVSLLADYMLFHSINGGRLEQWSSDLGSVHRPSENPDSYFNDEFGDVSSVLRRMMKMRFGEQKSNADAMQILRSNKVQAGFHSWT